MRLPNFTKSLQSIRYKIAPDASLDGWLSLTEETAHSGHIGCIASDLGPKDSTIFDQKGPRHLEAITSDQTNSASPEKGHGTPIHYLRTEKVPKTTLSKPKGPVKIAPRIGNPSHSFVFHIRELVSFFEHVNQNKPCPFFF